MKYVLCARLHRWILVPLINLDDSPKGKCTPGYCLSCEYVLDDKADVSDLIRWASINKDARSETSLSPDSLQRPTKGRKGRGVFIYTVLKYAKDAYQVKSAANSNTQKFDVATQRMLFLCSPPLFIARITSLLMLLHE